ncbi:hypothetical protein JB92DRAFT_899780 [Gautieria morchelliformis]|nr:hypothetical protein JB92DRAFT_899780 [Gautieria morchelliformis]
MASLNTFIDSEASLVQEAALAVPHSFDRCTHSEGAIRQPVHLCLSCAVPRGLCSACSVACHGNHEQIELFPKRAFTCDCPARVGDTDCALHKGTVAGNASNSYGQNFKAKFCRCHSTYDPKRERETMVQCVVCEDWYHESCLNLRTRPKERPPTPGHPVNESDDVADNDSNASNDLPPPLLSSSTYDSLICGACVLGNDTLQRWAGTRGVMMIVRKESDEECTTLIEDGGVDPRWKVLTHEDDGTEIVVVTEKEDQKRERDSDDHEVCGIEERATKKPRTEAVPSVIASSAMSLVPDVGSGTPCVTPPINFLAQKILIERLSQTSAGPAAKDTSISLLGEGDIFLTEGWRERWCRCPKCLPSLQKHPYLLEEEETYEPPEDPDSGLSLEELGMRALLNLPRDRAIEGIRAYNTMRDDLMAYLRPFAQEGRVVREEDVRDFFETKAQPATG